MDKRTQIKNNYDFAVSKLGMTWLEACNRYQEQSGQFPQEWTEEQKYYFSKALIAVEQNNILDSIETK